ncbi:MAG: TRAP transporter substrate-binding protein [bacterium]|nr:TRAP transporter substrate-binding protein [bacterium]
MKKIYGVILMVAAVIAMAFGGIFGGAAAAAEIKPRTMVFHYAGPLDCTNARFANNFKELVEKKSGGKLKVDIFGQNILGTDIDCLSTMKVGKVDFMVTVPAMVVNVIPALAVYDIPFTFKDVKSARKALADPQWLAVIGREYEKAGYHLLSTTDSNFRIISTNKEIKSIGDFKGMKLRTMENKNHIAFFEALGVKATPLNASEVYLALQQGMLQGQENPYSQVYDKKLYEVQKYVTNSNHIFHNIIFFTGQATWTSLQPEAQKIITEAANETAKMICEYSDKSEEGFRDKLVKERGMKFIDFDKIPGLREQLRKATLKGAKERAAKQVDPKLLEAYLKTCDIKD